jgi:iron complex outermembrane receptor protein
VTHRAAALLCAVALHPLAAQQDSSAAKLDPVVVTVTRGTARTVLGSPFAISVTRPDSTRPGLRNTSFEESIALVPGVTSVTRNNPSQDPRLSIRGFGARSAFGVRGIRVLRDGIPLTLPDGQTPLDYMSLESVGRIEVLRGAASALYGNAGGGVVDLHTDEPPLKPAIEAKQWLGSNAFARSVIQGAGTAGVLDYNADLSYTTSDGSRAHSRQRNTIGFSRARLETRNFTYSLSVMGLDNPLAENPGALTLEEMKSDPKMADALSVRRNARKAVNQLQVGLSAQRSTSRSDISFSAYNGARSLDNPLTFAVVEVGRHTWGATGAVRTRREIAGRTHSISIGFDAQSQNDLRRNFAVCADTVPSTIPTQTCPVPGSDRGAVTLDQRELVRGVGAYAGDEFDLTGRLKAGIALRADQIRFEVKDRFIANDNPDDSGDRTLGSLSSAAGILARLSPAHSLYFNFASAFETPTATELGNHPDGSAGINQDLDPQRSYTIEGGVKGYAGSFGRYDVALFDTRVRDELIPFEIPGSSGRRYFRNAGRTVRRGIEAGGDITRSIATLTVAYSYSHFLFDEYRVGTDDFAGKTIPGLPRHRLQSSLRLAAGKSFLVIENEVSGRAFADDANTFKAPGYSVSHARIGRRFNIGSPTVSLVLAAQNIFDRVYSPSLAVNAARSKYFEPAARRTLQGSVSVVFP